VCLCIIQVLSLLAQPDEKALKTLLNFLPSPPTPGAAARLRTGQVRMDWTRDCLAPATLAAFEGALLEKVIPPARLVNLREAPAYCRWR